MSTGNKKHFTHKLLQWHQTDNNRALPWKNTKNPYKIWLSEIILQQTRAEQGRPYYEKFAATYPTVTALAAADDAEVFKLWQGLGYYSRCRNLLHTARTISNDFRGAFPADYSALRSLKGIGPYTAAAIASFAFDLPYAVADGNVYRVLSRYFGIRTPFDSTDGKKEFQLLADELLDRQQSAAYNQAIMDFGATVCTPALPKCNSCPLQDECYAYQHNMVNALPVRSKKSAVKERYFHYLLLQHHEKIWMAQRSEKDIWQGLYQPYMIESDKALDTAGLTGTAGFRELGIEDTPEYEGYLRQRLTHQLIHTRFFRIKLQQLPRALLQQGIWADAATIRKMALPRTIAIFFEKKNYF